MTAPAAAAADQQSRTTPNLHLQQLAYLREVARRGSIAAAGSWRPLQISFTCLWSHCSPNPLRSLVRSRLRLSTYPALSYSASVWERLP